MEREVTSVSPLCVAKECNHVKDRISNLPDEILVTILSLLPLKEAGRSSVLSRRWMNLWKLSCNLDFDFDDTGFLEYFIRMGRFKIKMPIERPRYINWVNQVLKLHRGSNINKFRLRHDLNKSFGHVIDPWIEFAVEKKVQRLELDFSDSWGSETRLANAYSFPKSVLNSSTDHLDRSSNNFSNLISLSLISVNLSDEVVSYLLTTCTSLERLTIKDSFSLVNFKINAPTSLKLKYLEIGSCFSLENIEISAINLIVFKYHGNDLRMSLTNIPTLNECSFGGLYTRNLILEGGELPSWFSHLQKLVINMDFYHLLEEVYDRSTFYLRTFPKFEKLKHLEMETPIYRNESLKFLDSLIQVSPQLHKLVIKLTHEEPPKQKAMLDMANEVERLWSIEPPCTHQQLEIAEFIGWRGYKGEADFVVHLCEHAPRLSKVILDPRYPVSWHHRIVDMKQEGVMEDIARERAEFLQEELPPKVELIVL